MRFTHLIVLIALLGSLVYAAEKCNDACTTSADCVKCGNCRLCLQGVCQHRCADPRNWAACMLDTPSNGGNACGASCTTSTDCCAACGLCLSDQSNGGVRSCQHRCVAEENWAECSVNPVEQVDECAHSHDVKCLFKKAKSFFSRK